jgi:hypothetical protein
MSHHLLFSKHRHEAFEEGMVAGLHDWDNQWVQIDAQQTK